MTFKKAKLYDADGHLAARWIVYYFFKDPVTGKYKRFTHAIAAKFITRAQRYNRAQEIIKEINTKLQKGFDPFSSKNHSQTSLSASMEYFLEMKKRFLRPRSYISYNSYVNDLKDWAQENNYDLLPVESFNYNHAQQYIDAVGKRKISNRTYNNILQALKTCFNFLIEKEYVTVNPFFKQKKVRLEETELIAFNASELKIVSETLPDYNYNLYVVATLIFNCFLRPQEIVG